MYYTHFVFYSSKIKRSMSKIIIKCKLLIKNINKIINKHLAKVCMRVLVYISVCLFVCFFFTLKATFYSGKINCYNILNSRGRRRGQQLIIIGKCHRCIIDRRSHSGKCDSFKCLPLFYDIT